MNLDLVEAYYHLDTDKLTVCPKGWLLHSKSINYLLQSRCFLNKNMSRTAAFLGTYKGKNPYNEYSVSICWVNVLIKPENKQMAEECMRYVSTHGNTMPCKKNAQEWILSNMPKRIESSITN